MRPPSFAAALFAALLSPAPRSASADYILQRSFPQSASCAASSPTFSYVTTFLTNELSSANGCTADSPMSSHLLSCFNATHTQTSLWNSSGSCAGAANSSLPPAAVPAALVGCAAQPGGGGGSTRVTCESSEQSYQAPPSEPNVQGIFAGAGPCVAPAGVTVLPSFVASASADFPSCAAIASFYGDATSPPPAWGSLALSLTCDSGGLPTLNVSYFASSTACSGAAASITTIQGRFACSAISSSRVAQLQNWACPSSGAAASSALSGGAVAGIIIGVLLVLGAAAAALVFFGVIEGSASCGSGKATTGSKKGKVVFLPTFNKGRLFKGHSTIGSKVIAF